MSALLEKLVPESPPAGGEPEWLVEARRDARRELMRNGFPDARTEDWKYTSLKLLEKRPFSPGRESPREPLPPLPLEGHVLDFWEGRLAVPDDLPAGIRLRRLAEEPGPDGLVRRYGGREAAFAWLNTAGFTEGWVLEIDRPVDEPILLVWRTAEDFEGVVHPRLHVRLAAGASARLVEMHLDGGKGLVNRITTVRLESGARLDHARLQHTCAEAIDVERNDVSVAADARYDWLSLDLGGRLVRHDLNIALEEPEAATSVNGVFLGDGRTHVDHHTLIDHRVGPSYSEENFRGLLAGRSRGVFNGRIHVQPGADGSASEMNNANLLLSEHAEMDTKPELEIYADEVTAAHGATVGQLDEDALFYLTSRGIPQAQGRVMLKQAFAAAIIEATEPEALREDWLGRMRDVLQA